MKYWKYKDKYVDIQYDPPDDRETANGALGSEGVGTDIWKAKEIASNVNYMHNPNNESNNKKQPQPTLMIMICRWITWKTKKYQKKIREHHSKIY